MSRQVLAALVAFALLVSGIVGVTVHASHGAGLHGHDDALELVAADAAADTSSLAHGHGPGPSDQSEQLCLDYLCHGGWAVLQSVDAVAYRLKAIVVGTSIEVSGSGTTPAPLDRPPSFLRS